MVSFLKKLSQFNFSTNKGKQILRLWRIRVNNMYNSVGSFNHLIQLVFLDVNKKESLFVSDELKL